MKLILEALRESQSRGKQGGPARAAATSRLENLCMPRWALGRLMDLAADLTEMTCRFPPPVARKTIVVMAGDHGVVEEGTSLYPREVTRQMVYNFIAGGAAINVLAKRAGAEVTVVDMGVDGDFTDLVQSGKIISKKIAPGTRNMVLGPAMTRDEAIRAVEAGIAIARELSPSTDVFGTGEMGIGNTTSSSAVVAALCDEPAERVTGRGTGLDDSRLHKKIQIVEAALTRNRPDPGDPMDVLRKVGGFEIGGIAGLILGAAAAGKPVVIDGFISTAGALIADRLAPGTAKKMIAAHQSVEPGHAVALDRLGLEPLLNLGLRLGEGTGAALAMLLVDVACGVLTEMPTFEEAEVSRAG